jgi:hypothetical protein
MMAGKHIPRTVLEAMPSSQLLAAYDYERMHLIRSEWTEPGDVYRASNN